MKTNLKIWIVIFSIVAAGVLITRFTTGYVSRQTARYAADSAGLEETAAAQEIPAEEETLPSMASAKEAVTDTEDAGAESAGDQAAPAAGTAAAGDSGEPALAETESQNASAAAIEETAAEDPVLARAMPEGEGDSVEGGTARASEEAVADAAPAAAAVIPQEAGAAEGESAVSEEAAPSVSLYSAQEGDAETEDYRTQLAGIRERLPQVEAQIERLRSADTDNNVYNVRNLAQSEQKIWERELDTVYNLLMEALPENEAEMLKKDQQSWLEETTKKAREASGKVSGTSMESVEYAASVAESSRARVYALLDTYE